MTDRVSKDKRSRNMASVKSKNTKLELKVRKALWAKNLRYRINYKITGTPDIVFPKKKIALFINGCFWHHHGCKKSSIPKSNTEFWNEKLRKNTERDKKILKELRDSGWETMTIWECELIKNFDYIINNIITIYNENSYKNTRKN